MIIWLNSPLRGNREFIFLDRDGVVNEDRSDYVKNAREFRLYPDAIQALQVLRRRNISVVIISNQSGINRGLISWDNFWEIHDTMINRIREDGGEILAALYCPHRPDELCACRKPQKAMIEAACLLLGINPAVTWFFGDKATDMETARNAGCRGGVVKRGPARQTTRNGLQDASPVYSNLLDAVLSAYG